jgi:hypothetical protein
LPKLPNFRRGKIPNQFGNAGIGGSAEFDTTCGKFSVQLNVNDFTFFEDHCLAKITPVELMGELTQNNEIRSRLGKMTIEKLDNFLKGYHAKKM